MVGNVTNRPHPHDLHGKLTRHLAQSGRYQGIYFMDENLYYASGPGTFEVVKSGRHRYYYDDAGSLSRDVSRGMNVSYDLNGNPVFMAYNAGSETEAGYTAGGQKLWTVHRTAAGTIPADVLSDPNKPKPTPEIGTTPSQYSRLSDCLIQSVDVTRYYDGFEFYDRNLTEGKFYFSNGYVSFHTDGSFDYSALITDYRGSTRVVMTMDSTLSTSNIVQANSYYPSGALVTDVQTSVQLGSTSGDVQTHKFMGKELDRMYGLDWYDLGARRYDAAAVTFWAMDPLCEQYYHISPYSYCAGDPVNKIDPDGQRPKASEAALMAAYVYGDDDISSQYMNQLEQTGWKISEFKSSIEMNYTRFYQNGLQSILFERTVDGVTEYAYVYAGTNSIEDALEDVAQLAGAAPQYHTAVYNARTLSKELGDNELTFVGHSLGGGEAIASSMATGRAAITFNPAAVSWLTKQLAGLNEVPDVVNYRAIGSKIGIGNIRVGGDMLNNFQEKFGLSLPGTTIGIPTGIIPTHTIDDFLKQNLPEL